MHPGFSLLIPSLFFLSFYLFIAFREAGWDVCSTVSPSLHLPSLPFFNDILTLLKMSIMSGVEIMVASVGAIKVRVLPYHGRFQLFILSSTFIVLTTT